MALRPWIEEKAELEEALFESNCSEVLQKEQELFLHMLQAGADDQLTESNAFDKYNFDFINEKPVVNTEGLQKIEWSNTFAHDSCEYDQQKQALSKSKTRISLKSLNVKRWSELGNSTEFRSPSIFSNLLSASTCMASTLSSSRVGSSFTMEIGQTSQFSISSQSASVMFDGSKLRLGPLNRVTQINEREDGDLDLNERATECEYNKEIGEFEYSSKRKSNQSHTNSSGSGKKQLLSRGDIDPSSEQEDNPFPFADQMLEEECKSEDELANVVDDDQDHHIKELNKPTTLLKTQHIMGQVKSKKML